MDSAITLFLIRNYKLQKLGDNRAAQPRFYINQP